MAQKWMNATHVIPQMSHAPWTAAIRLIDALNQLLLKQKRNNSVPLFSDLFT